MFLWYISDGLEFYLYYGSSINWGPDSLNCVHFSNADLFPLAKPTSLVFNYRNKMTRDIVTLSVKKQQSAPHHKNAAK